MSLKEQIWSVGLFVLLGLALWVFRRLRRPTDDFQQSMVARERLAPWARQFEVLVFAALTTGSAIGAAFIFFRVLCPILHVHPMLTGASALYFATGCGLAVIPGSLLASNILLWLIPPVRLANLKATEGLKVSFWTANRGLLLASAVTVPLGLVLLAMCLQPPWRA